MEILKAAIRSEKGYLYPSLDIVAGLALKVDTVEQGVVYTMPGEDKVRSWRCQTLPPSADDRDACYVENELVPGGAWFVYTDGAWTQVLSLMVNMRRVFAYHKVNEDSSEQYLALAMPIIVDDGLRIQYAEAHHIDLLVALMAFEAVICESISTGQDTDDEFAHAEVDV